MLCLSHLTGLLTQSLRRRMPEALRRVVRRLRDHRAMTRASFPPRWVTMHAGSEALHHEILTSLLPDGHEPLSLLDVGCGTAPVTRTFACQKRTFLDVARPDSPPEPFLEADALSFIRETRPYDMIFSLDMIEHLDRPIGEELLALMPRKARRLAVFFTPLGPMLINPHDPRGHRSGWWPEEFEALGYRTWAFPRFHDPWMDGHAWGAFYAWKWMKPEPTAALRLAEIASRLGLADHESELMDEAFLARADAEQASHWRRSRELYRPRLFPLPKPRRH